MELKRLKGYEHPKAVVHYWSREVTVLCSSSELESYTKTDIEYDD